MRTNFKKAISYLLVLALALPLGSFPFISKTFAMDDGVKVTVTDGSGIKGSVSNAAAFISETNPNPKVQGSARAEISYSGSSANKLWYQFVHQPVANQNAMPTTQWIEIPLNGSTENPDIQTGKPGYLNRRSYDVTMLPNVTDTATWENRNLVFKYPFEAREIISAETTTALVNYGTYVSYIDYQDIEKRRFHANTVFGALNGNGDFYPPDDYFYIKSKKILTGYKIEFDSNGKPYFMLNGSKKVLTLSGSKYYYGDSIYSDSSSPSAKYQESSKFWGYLKAPESGTFRLGLISDDGSTGKITVNGVSYKFSDSFKVQGSTWNSTGTNSVNLVAGKYYPISLEYFNWGGGSRFQLYYSKSNFSSTKTNGVPNNATAVPANWLYPSKTDTPGEYADTTFAGASGVNFPSAVGDYYVLYKATNTSGAAVVSGCYGPFTIPGSADVTLSKKAVYSDGSPVTNVQSLVPFNLQYTVKPKDIIPNAILGNAATIYLKNVRIQDDLTDGLQTDLTDGFIVTKASETNVFVFPDATNDPNKFTYVLPNIAYHLTTLPDGSKVYQSETDELTYTVGVKLKATDDSVQISEDQLSILTYSDPSNGAQVSKEFENGLISAGVSIMGSVKLTDKNDNIKTTCISSYPYTVKLAFDLDRASRGDIKFVFDGSNVPKSAITKVTVFKGSVQQAVVPVVNSLGDDYSVDIPALTSTGFDSGSYTLLFNMDGSKMLGLGTIPFEYSWKLEDVQIYDFKDEERTTDLGDQVPFVNDTMTMSVVSAPKLD